MNRDRVQSIQAAQDYTNRKKRKLLNAITGNNAGTVETGTGDLWWIRLHSDSNQVVRARSSRDVAAVADLDIVVELVNRTGIPYYQILGRAVGILYPTEPYANIVIAHHEQHERTDAGEGGTDPIDVFPRMAAHLRAHEQDTPDMTVRVDAGEGAIGSTHLLWTGGNSPAFTPPTNFRKFDLLYLGTDNALHIQTGTEAGGWGLPSKTALATSGIPIAWILLSPSTTTITESIIYDAGMLRGAVNYLTGENIGFVIKTAAYTLTVSDTILYCNSATAYTQSLPAASGSSKVYYIKNINAGVITLDGNSSDTIDGELTQTISQNECITVHDYAANKWAIL